MERYDSSRRNARRDSEGRERANHDDRNPRQHGSSFTLSAISSSDTWV